MASNFNKADDVYRKRPDIASMDAETQAREIVFALSSWDFPWDIEKSLEFALFRTYAVPSISSLLARTGEFDKRTRKRYDDTELILAEITEHGPDHGRGAAALARMNEMHARFRIANEDFIYVLSTFIFEPQRWLDQYGWRKLTGNEKRAMFNYYHDLGRRMGIKNLPETPQAFEAFNREYEAKHFRYAETNALIGNKTLDLLLGFYLPKSLFGLARPAAYAMMDKPLLEAMGFREPPAVLRKLVPAGLRMRAKLLAILPKRKKPHLLTSVRRPTYPNGYEVEELGTFAPKIASEKQSSELAG